MTVKTMGRITLVAGRSFGQQIQEWVLRARTRRQLRALDDRLLNDIGMTRARVEREAAKPFWQA